MATKPIMGFKGDSGHDATSLIEVTGVSTNVLNLAAMTISPEATAETGYITIVADGVTYQIPIYAA